MKSLKDEVETMQDPESENGIDGSISSSKEELENPARAKKKWTKKPKKNKKTIF